MTIPPCWQYCSDKEPGDIMSAAKTSRALVKVHDLHVTASLPLTARTYSPRRWFMAYFILPAVAAAMIMAVVTAHSAGLF